MTIKSSPLLLKVSTDDLVPGITNNKAGGNKETIATGELAEIRARELVSRLVIDDLTLN